MKKIRIKHRKTDYAVEFKSDDQAFIDAEIARITAKAQLWKSGREVVEFSESYDEADVLSRRSESVGEGVINYVTLRAEYEIIEVDLTQDYEWLLSECYRQRLAEYPTLAEISEALMEKFGENRPQKFDEIHNKRMAVKAKYKKPTNHNL